MILYIQLILIVVLLLILTALYLEEKEKKKLKIPRGTLTQIWDGSERRRFVRIPVDIPVKYNLPKKINNTKAIKTKDISIGGICMTISEKFNPHTRLCLEISFGESSVPILANGEIIWVKENMKHENEEGIRYFNVGIEFKDILPQDRERLVKFIKEAGHIQRGKN